MTADAKAIMVTIDSYQRLDRRDFVSTETYDAARNLVRAEVERRVTALVKALRIIAYEDGTEMNAYLGDKWHAALPVWRQVAIAALVDATRSAERVGE